MGGGEGLTVEGSSREINGDKIPVTFDGTGVIQVEKQFT